MTSAEVEGEDQSWANKDVTLFKCVKWIQMKWNTFYIGHIFLTLNYDWNYSKCDAK